jgi:hypothetical protein
MNKRTKTAIAIGVVAVAGYLIYRQSQKKSFANLTFNAPLAKCPRSPNTSIGGQDNTGRDIYACCKRGQYAYAPSETRCDGSSTTPQKANQFTVQMNPTSNF